jgi:lysophospholipase L1-like esterase
MSKQQTSSMIFKTGATLTLVAMAWLWLASVGRSQTIPDEAVLSRRSLLSEGNTARLQQVLAKGRRGEPVTIGVIGGSITQGAAASKPENRYGNRVAAWWREQFPKAEVKFVNAGIGATGSDYGALRAGRDLLSKHPDLVIAEYAVNDGNTRAAAETLEGLVRQVLKQANQPGLVLLFTMNQAGGNAQEWQGKVGAHYALPMVSYRDALWPEIQAGRMTWSDISPDSVHPNDRGHAYCAQGIIHLLKKVLADLPPDDRLTPIKTSLPPPLLSDVYEHAALFEADALKPVANQGWAYDSASTSWKSDQPGSAIEFEVEGRRIVAMHYVVRGPMGRVKVTVDAGGARELNGWFDQTWGGYRQSNEIARDLSPGRHRIRFELLTGKSDASTGHEFRILGLGAAGVN